MAECNCIGCVKSEVLDLMQERLGGDIDDVNQNINRFCLLLAIEVVQNGVDIESVPPIFVEHIRGVERAMAGKPN